MKRYIVSILAIAAVALLAGCDDEPEPTCEGVEGACETEGELQCNDDATGILECRENDDGCLAWAESELCDEGQQCDDSGDEPACAAACTDECDAGDADECDGDLIVTCGTDDDGCHVWVESLDCGESDETCDDSGDEPVCTAACTDECDAEGDTECDGTVIQICGLSAAGCMILSSGDDCAATDQLCDDSAGDAECVDPCTDECETDGDTQCNGTVIETCGAGAGGCLAWIAGTDCSTTDEVCDDSGAEALCTGCTDLCDAEGDTQCDGDVIQTCDVSVGGCLDWLDGTDCSAAGESCDDSSGTAECVTGCVDACDTAGDVVCDGTVVATCTLGLDGCLDLIGGEDCALHDPPWVCDDSSGDAECADPAVVDVGSCANPVVLTGDHLALAGSDFTADYGDHVTFADTASCVERTSGQADVVIAADLLAGQTVRLAELGAFDSVLSLQLACNDAEPCVFSSDLSYDESGGQTYTAAADGRVYFVVEAWSATPTSTAYDIRLDIAAPEDCDDGIDDDFDDDIDCADTDCAGVAPCEATETSCADDFDNDADGDVDCDDTDCFGVIGACAVELNCGDGVDNDADTATDCADTDCTGVAPCEATETSCADDFDNDSDGDVDCDDTDCDTAAVCAGYIGIYELFPSSNPVDVEGYSIFFTPDATAPMQYTWEAVGGTVAFPITPGSGTTTATLTLTDDSTASHTLTTMAAGITFYGVTYPSLWVSSNGYVTLASSYSDYGPTEADFFGRPLIAPFWTDLNPASATLPGVVTVDEFADRVAVTFNHVARYNTSEPTSVQLIIHDDGSIEFHLVDVSSSTSRATLIGISSGTGMLPYPPETNFVTLPPETVCDDAVDSDLDGLTDCDDSDCFGAVGLCDAEENCDDGADNDLDSKIDCADEDCDGIGDCELIEVSCGDVVDNDADGATDCADTDCTGVAPCEPVEVSCTDDFDNDSDGTVDCDDSDCDAVAACQPYTGIYELFDIAPDVFDLEGRVVIFTPDAAAEMGYTVSTVAGTGAYAVTPGTGTVTATLALTDDSDATHNFTSFGSFEFYGVDYTSVAVNSNGHVTFGGAYDVILNSVSELFAHPTIAILGQDMNPAAATAGDVIVDEFADAVAITWNDVPFYGETPLNRVQMLLNDDGSIELHYVAVPVAGFDDYDTLVVGISAGGTGSTYPAETNFVP